jgi:hypothetical protein
MTERKRPRAHRLDRQADFEGESVWYINGNTKWSEVDLVEGGHDAAERYVIPVEWRRCSGAGVRDQREQTWLAAFKCSRCEAQFDEDEVTLVEGKPLHEQPAPPHVVMLTHEMDLEEKVQVLCQTVGMDWWDAPLGDWRRTLHQRSKDEAMAEVVQSLATGLAKRAAIVDTAKAIQAIQDLKIGDEFIGFPDDNDPDQDRNAPFFTERFLYPLVGKDAARTLLAYWRSVREAAGVGR